MNSWNKFKLHGIACKVREGPPILPGNNIVSRLNANRHRHTHQSRHERNLRIRKAASRKNGGPEYGWDTHRRCLLSRRGPNSLRPLRPPPLIRTQRHTHPLVARGDPSCRHKSSSLTTFKGYQGLTYRVPMFAATSYSLISPAR